MDGTLAIRVRITGQVQGVWFRAWTVENALSLGLRGWVRNRHDGSVEALFVGRAEDVARMIERCHIGPPAARVAAVHQAEEAPPDPPPATFTTAPTA